jgi:hypothetical protein
MLEFRPTKYGIIFNFDINGKQSKFDITVIDENDRESRFKDLQFTKQMYIYYNEMTRGDLKRFLELHGINIDALFEGY